MMIRGIVAFVVTGVAFAAVAGTLPQPREVGRGDDAALAFVPVGAPITDPALGVIGAVAVDGDGRLYALDVQARRIGIVAPGAAPIFIGGEGAGPGEFLAPVRVEVDTGGRVLVMDRGTLRIELYRTDEAETRRTGSLRLPFPAEDVAVCEGRLFLLGSWDGHLIHEIAAEDGRVIRSFAPDSDGADDLSAGYRSSGYLECGPGPSLTFLPLLRPELTRYAIATGTIEARLQIPGYRGVVVEGTPDGGLAFRAPEGGHETAASLLTLADGRQLAQVGVLADGARTRHELGTLRSFLVSWSEPDIQPLAEPLPRILAASGDHVFAVDSDPEPRIRPGTLRPAGRRP